MDLTEKTNTLPTTDSRTGSSTARVKHFSQFTRVWQRLRRSAILYGLFATIIRVGASILLLPLILKRFSPAELALWWVFVALGAIANLADFGFGQAISRVYTYLWAGAEDFDTEGLRPPPAVRSPNYTRIRLFNATVRYFYVRASWFAIGLLIIGGTPFVLRLIQPPVTPLWVLICWGSFILATGFTLGSSHWMLACQGINRVRDLQGAIFWSGLAFLISAALMLWFGCGLETMVVATAIRAVTIRQFCVHTYREAVPDERGQRREVDLTMLKRLWPNAWKFSVLALGAYLIANGTTLICSQFLGAEVTASFGLTVQVGNFLGAIAGLWLAVKWPQITMLRTQGRLQEMGVLFARRLSAVMATLVLLAVVLLLAGNRLLELKGTRTQLLATPLLGVYLAYVVQQQFYVHFGTLTFTENVVPFFKISIFTGIGLLCLTVVMTRMYGLWGLVIAPLIATLACSSWYVVYRGFRGQPLSPQQFVRAALFAHL